MDFNNFFQDLTKETEKLFDHTSISEYERNKLRSERLTKNFNEQMATIVDEMKAGNYEDEEGYSSLLMDIAKIVEITDGEMPFPICTLCGSDEDGHYNNNAECS